MQPGIYPNIPEETYFASDGVSVSTIKTFAKAPAKARYGIRKETKAQAMGSLIHCAVLEPEQLERRYKPTTLERRGTKAWETEELAAGGRELVKLPDWHEALSIRDAVFKHPIAQEILSRGLEAETSFYWIDPETSLLCRGRADGLRRDIRVIADVKSTEDASRDGFGRSAASYKYHWQNAHYVDGFTALADNGGFIPEAFILFAIEKEPPYLVGAYEIDPHDVGRGRQAVHTALRGYRDCLAANVWPGYSDTLETLSLPGWSEADDVVTLHPVAA